MTNVEHVRAMVRMAWNEAQVAIIRRCSGIDINGEDAEMLLIHEAQRREEARVSGKPLEDAPLARES
jgi:hypothetical protein